MKQSTEISIVIPVKDEGASIKTLYDEINHVFSRESLTYEIIWVNDGSTDNTLDILKQLHETDPKNRYVSFYANAGQSAALMAGFEASKGVYIATLDGDGQNDPADIPKLYERLIKDGTDMVNGYREKRKDSQLRRIASKIANNVRNAMTGKTVKDVGCSTRLFKRDIFRVFPRFKGMHRFIPTFAVMYGFTISEIPVNHRERKKGKTKYTINNRLWVGIYDIIGAMWLKNRSYRYRVREFSTDQTKD